MPLPLAVIPIAVELAKAFFPPLVGRLTNSKDAEAVAAKVVKAATETTKEADPEKALEVLLAKPELVLQFRGRLLEHQELMAKLEYQAEAAERKDALEDVQHSRNRDVEVRKVSGGRNVRADVLAYSAVAMFALALWRIFDTPIPEGIQRDLLVYLLGALTTLVVMIYQYEFGSSMGSVRNGAMVRQSLEKIVGVFQGKGDGG